MSALRLPPQHFGYRPALEARLESERALQRAMPASVSLVLVLLLGAGLAQRYAGAPGTPSGPVFRVLVHQFSPPPSLVPPAARPNVVVVPPLEAHGANVVPVRDDLSPPPESHATVSGGEAGGTGPASGAVAEGPPAGAILEPEPAPQPGDAFLGEELPNKVSAPAPEYPDLARSAGVEGTVMLWAMVDLDGSVREVRVLKSVPLLDDAAAGAVKRWRFTPALSNHHPVRVWIAVPVRFSLH